MARNQMIQPMRLIRIVALALVAVIVISACQTVTVTKDPAAQNLVPNLIGYTIQNTTDITGAIGNVAGGAALVSGQAPIALLIKAASAIAKCYQDVGAIEGRTYIKASDPSKAAVLFIVNQNVITNPQTFIKCISPQKAVGSSSTVLQPCGKGYALNKDNNTFYIGFVATDTEVCTTLCSQLQGCTFP